MPTLNFQPRFADIVESGVKTQTIRKTCRAKVGDTVYLYTGQRTKQCRKLGEGVVTEVRRVYLVRDMIDSSPRLFLETSSIPKKEIDAFAQSDGFTNAKDMFDWFNKVHGLPFRGWLIKWELRK